MGFRFLDTELDYFDHPYNDTIHNERAIEVAIALYWLDRHGAGLEVGNVLGHYGLTGHRVVDLHEEAPGVENIDVFDITGSYDWIVAISTVEHVGRDEEPKDPDAAERAICHLRSLLAPDGYMLVTVPGGYHPVLDQALPTIGADVACTYRRSPSGWERTDGLCFLPYGSSTQWAESVWVGMWSPA